MIRVVQRGLPLREPVQRLGLLLPPADRIGLRPLVLGPVANERLLGELRGRIERVLVEKLGESLVEVGVLRGHVAYLPAS